MTIRILSRETAEKIAAGEVIERPFSVVKELLDNSVDAGATRITIEIVAGGKEYIKVSDNGAGIVFDELPTAFMRHATSKIQTMEDFDELNTLGFRGEALPSIAAISKVTLLSKPFEQLTAGEIVFEGGERISYTECAAREGTTIIVEKLFFNTPARLKFLKTDSHEASLIGELVSEYALGNPNISFEFISQGKHVLRTSGKGNLRETIAEVWGRQTAAMLVEQDYILENLTVKGFFSPFELQRSSRKNQVFFVNRRLVKNPLLHTALEEPYKGVLPHRKYPLALVNIELPPDTIDVNVHPAKTLIKFHNDRLIFSAVRNTVNTTLMTPNKITVDSNLKSETQTVINSYKQEGIEQNYQQPRLKEFEKIGVENPYKQFEAALPYLREHKTEAIPPIQETKLFPRLNYLATYKNSYLLTQSREALYLVDQHAAHERILYEALLNKLMIQDAYAQVLLEPTVVELPVHLKLLATEILINLKDLGFDIELFGEASYIIRAVPNFFSKTNLSETLLDIMNEIVENKKNRTQELLAQKLACKAAIKLNQPLTRDEAEKLLYELSTCEEPFRCPHGRPTIVEIADDQIEKWFKRILS